MLIQYLPFKEILEPDNIGINEFNRNYNRAILSIGVEGKACLEVRDITKEDKELVKDVLPVYTYLSTVECYSNGGKNIFVRGEKGKVVGVVKVLPGRIKTEPIIKIAS